MATLEKSAHSPSATIQQDSDPCAPGATAGSLGLLHQNILISNQSLTDVNPLVCGQQVCAPGYSYGPKIRFYYLIHYIVSGKGSFLSKGVTTTVSRGQLFLIQPGDITYYQADKIDPWHYRWIGFSSDLDLSDVFSKNVITAPECDHIFRSFIQCEKIENMREYYVCAKIFELIALLAQHSDISHNVGREYALKAKNFIDTNFSDCDLTVSYLADLLCLDRSYFSSVFKKHLDKSPQQYLVDFRLEKAAEMLVTNKQPLAHISDSCGYSDLYNFSKMFKKKYGVSPSQYSKARRSAE